MWYECGTFELSTKSTMTTGIDVSGVGLSSPSVSADRAYNITDPDNVTDATVAILTGSSSITTSIWTPPLINPAATESTYRIECDISDGGQTILLVLIVKSGAY